MSIKKPKQAAFDERVDYRKRHEQKKERAQLLERAARSDFRAQIRELGK